ncbi:LysE family translocator [Thermaerobacillus caldiproteolyticus]|uniref:RhtB (Resistance to homoserine/threonine) family protein n=1 Tax=Thermaerobacillus caldiproteolyticus TaxID=247480 RepID=A0A7V9Z7Q9_9BACL|nr:LysE family translocator [Anoxybacillus caldiproteolyticus]MBA2875583.1 RhtB (resistance to homoserine/threonine) family protein [Anoxybacillus caldiproteolyticus]QPA30502.1 LysE family translocator [Anoxybacillus caldiproteolyticus]
MFLEVFLVGILAAMSPGPDFFVVMRNSLEFGYRVGIATAFGITLALIVHITYTILGFAYVMQAYPSLFISIKILGALYLIWLGYNAIRSAPPKNDEKLKSEVESVQNNKTLMQGFREGFLCNVLNPKAALFFLSIFSQFIKRDTTGWTHWIYGSEIIFAVGGWFVLLAILISYSKFRSLYKKYAYWFDRLLGGILIYFAIRIMVSAVKLV